MQKQIASWNTARDVWEIPGTAGLLCEHSDVYSEAWPTSGSMRNGAAYGRPTSEPLMPGSGSLSLLPTVTASEMTGPGRSKTKTGGDNLRTLVTLLPTPTTQDGANNGGPSQFERNTPPLNTRVLMPGWEDFEPAMRRWEAVMGPAPVPTEVSAKGKRVLSARFAEWMMGQPAGWVTDPAIGISRGEQIKACGNGVVTQQAVAALRDMREAFDKEER